MEGNSHPDCTSQRRRFTSTEDQKIIHLVEDLKIHSWEAVAKHIPFRTASQCRDRYNHYLSVKVVNKPWSLEEDEIIYNKFKEIGPLWSVIAKDLPIRNGSCIGWQETPVASRDQKEIATFWFHIYKPLLN